MEYQKIIHFLDITPNQRTKFKTKNCVEIIEDIHESYNTNSQLNKLKLGIKNGTEVTLKISSNVVGDSNNENSFLHKLLSTNAQVSKLRKAFANNSSANIKLSKTQLHKIGQSGGFFSRLLGSLLKTGLPLMKIYLNH